MRDVVVPSGVERVAGEPVALAGPFEVAEALAGDLPGLLADRAAHVVVEVARAEDAAWIVAAAGREASHHNASTPVPTEKEANEANTGPNVCFPKAALINACNGNKVPIRTARPRLTAFIPILPHQKRATIRQAASGK